LLIWFIFPLFFFFHISIFTVRNNLVNNADYLASLFCFFFQQIVKTSFHENLFIIFCCWKNGLFCFIIYLKSDEKILLSYTLLFLNIFPLFSEHLINTSLLKNYYLFGNESREES